MVLLVENMQTNPIGGIHRSRLSRLTCPILTLGLSNSASVVLVPRSRLSESLPQDPRTIAAVHPSYQISSKSPQEWSTILRLASIKFVWHSALRERDP